MSQQLSLDGMPEPLYAASPARLSTFTDCPRRYRLGYLDRPTPARGAAWAHTSVGAAVHYALAKWWDLPRARRTPQAGGALLVGGWPTDGFRDDRQRADARGRSREQVERYLAGVDPDDRPIGVERTVAVTTPRASLWGRVDRIDQRGAGIVVVDYKTGRSVLTVDDARSSLALAVYAAGSARMLRRDCTRVELHHLPTGDVVAWEHTSASLAAHLSRADALAARLRALDDRFREGLSAAAADEVFPARVGSHCGWCSVRSACGPGQAVPRRQPWAGIES